MKKNFNISRAVRSPEGNRTQIWWISV